MRKMRLLYHGGIGGLGVGEVIRPAISVGKAHPPSPNQPGYNPHRVYLTGIAWYAELFAHLRDGDVYQVRPLGRLIRDPDARGSFACSAAMVVAVIARHPVRLPAIARDALAQWH